MFEESLAYRKKFNKNNKKRVFEITCVEIRQMKFTFYLFLI